MKPRIRLVVERAGSNLSDVEIIGDKVTPVMLDAAEDLLHALSSGERLLPKDLYDTCARAFNTTRDDAKERLLAAMYGKRAADEPYLIGWTWRAHLDQLHGDVRAGRWLRVSKALAMMLGHALFKLPLENAPQEEVTEPCKEGHTFQWRPVGDRHQWSCVVCHAIPNERDLLLAYVKTHGGSVMP
jgi:hypothetical protein